MCVGGGGEGGMCAPTHHTDILPEKSSKQKQTATQNPSAC